jgi:multidrug efflux pump
MTFGTALTLFVVPTAYLLLSRDRSKTRVLADPSAVPAE